MDVAEHAGLGELERRREGERQQTQDLKRSRGLGSEAEGKEARRAWGSWACWEGSAPPCCESPGGRLPSIEGSRNILEMCSGRSQ